MSGWRLDEGGLIDRSRTIGFGFDGRRYQGHPGDTLASALLAAGVGIVGRSFKYHRPRGVMSAGVEEAGALVTVGAGARRDPNVRATAVELFDGLEAHGQHAWPSVRFDLGAIAGLFSRFIPAGFYYKTFMGPGRGTGAWMLYERAIRRSAGMGAASREPDPDTYETTHAHCDVLVAGSGPAGLEAALAAAEAGLRVIVAEQDFALGGALLWESEPVGENSPADWRSARVEALQRSDRVTCLPRTTVFGLYDGGVAGMLERVTDHLAEPWPDLPRHRLWIVRAKQTIVATGALERTIAFGNNDRPGVMLADAARSYARRFGVAAGRRAVVATDNDSGYRAAIDLARAGIEVAALLDSRERSPEGPAAELKRIGIPVRHGTVPVQAAGRAAVRRLRVGRRTGRQVRAADWIECDLVAVSGGWSPVVHLASHRGSRPVYDDSLAAFLPGPIDEPVHVAGAAAGIWRVEDCVHSGRAAGNIAARALGRSAPEPELPSPGGWSLAIRPVWEVRVDGQGAKRFVDPQNDVTTADIRLAHREGFASAEHLKRYTTLGMAADQGKVGNVIGLAILAEAAGRPIAETGTTTFRPPYTPVTLGTLAGRGCGPHFRPTRRTPMDRWHRQRGAVMTDAGLWQRPWYYPRDGEDLATAYVREARAVRGGVGLCDVSTLGKIAVQGPDAGAFLDRVYVNGFSGLAAGRARYGVMLRDDGIVMDDGTVWRLAETDFFVTTTTANAATVLAWLEELLETRWPELRVCVTAVTEQWAGMAVAGPRARDVLAAVIEEIDLSDAAFPFMAVRDGRVAGAPCRVARLSFSGELAYEVMVPADHGEAMCAALWRAAEPVGGVLYGLEALGALRIEKGHVAGQELDGRTTLDDLGLGGMASSSKPFIGDVLRKRPEFARPDRQRLVGIVPVDRARTLHAGAILCAPEKVAGHGEGWVSSVTFSPELGHWIGLALISGGLEAWRDRIAVAADPVRGSDVEVEIVAPRFVDPEGSRLHG